MADVLTTVWGLVKQTIGGNRNTWGGIINSNWDTVEAALSGITAKVVTGGTYALTDTERRRRILKFTGLLASNQIITIPNLTGKWIVSNQTTGDFTLSFKTTDGDPAVIPQGGWCEIWCDGADAISAGPSTSLFNKQMLVPDGTLAAPGYSFINEIKSGLRRSAAKTLAVTIDGIDIVTITGTTLLAALSDNSIVINKRLEVPSILIGGQAPIPIGTATSFDGIREPNGWMFKNGRALSRVDYAGLFAALTETANGTRTNGSATLSAVDKDLTGLGLEGAKVEGVGISSGTTISSITTTTIVLSTTVAGSGAVALRIFPHGNGDGAITFNIPDDRGYVEVGRDNMGGTPVNRVTVAGSGLAGTQLGRAGGSEAITLTATQLAAHTHSGTTGNDSPDHTHGYTAQVAVGGSDGGPFSAITSPSSSSTGGASTRHQHSFTTSSVGGDGPHSNVQPSRVTNKIIFTGVYS